MLVVATDGAGKYDFTVVHISVADINDNAPVFHMSEYRTSIHSNFTVNSSFFKVKESIIFDKWKMLFCIQQLVI